MIPFLFGSNTKYAGYELDRFPSPPSLDFLCTLCGMVARDPMECKKCGRLFCALCLFCRNHATTQQVFDLHCPHCGPNEKPRSPSKILIRIINELKIFCRFKDNGCNKKIRIGKIPKHECSCIFKEVSCENSKICCKRGLIEDFFEVKFSLIMKNGFACSKLCKKQLKFQNLLAGHKTSEILKLYFKCIQAATNPV